MSKKRLRLENRIKNLENSQIDFRKWSNTMIIVGVILFFISFDGGFLYKTFSLGQVGLTLIVIGLVTKWTLPKSTSTPGKAVKEKQEETKQPTKQIKRRQPTSQEGMISQMQKHMVQYMPKKDQADLESNIGAQWFARIGAVSLVIGIIFFLKYAFDKDIIPPEGRVLIGVSAAFVLIGLGEYFDRKKYVLYARSLTGAGFAVLYASIFAAHNFYHLVSLFVDLIVLIVVVAVAIAFALRYNSILIASLAFILGYLTAYLTGNSNIHMLGYSSLLTAGLLVIVYKKGWKYLGLGGMIATYIIHLKWLAINPEGHLTHLLFLTLYLVMFGIASIRLSKTLKSKNQDQFAHEVKVILFILFLISFSMGFVIEPSNVYYLAYFLLLSLGIASIMLKYAWGELAAGGVFATYVSYMVWNGHNKNDPNVILYSAIFLSIYFLLYTILSFFIVKNPKDLAKNVTKASKNVLINPASIIMVLANTFFYYGLAYVEFERSFSNFTGLFTFCFSVFLFAASLIAYRCKNKALATTYLTLAITFFTLTIPIQLNNQWITIAWAIQALVLVVLGVKLNTIALRVLGYIVASLASLKTAFIDAYSLTAFNLNSIVGSTRLYVFIVTIAVLYYLCHLLYRNRESLNKQEMLASTLFGAAGTALTTWILYLEGNDWSTLLWTIQAFVVLIIGFVKKKKEILFASGIISVLITLKLVAVDSSLPLFQTENILDSTRVIVFGFAILIFYITARLYEKYPSSTSIKKPVSGAIVYDSTATLLTTLLLALEFQKEWMSVAWAVQAIIVLIAGVSFNKKQFRQLGILIFGLTIGKVFIIDFQELEVFFRIISFIGLGILLLVAAYVYHRFKDRIRGFV